ncbi:hypothetical protein [Ferrovibrio terrae]|uniref:hypothetical protein n=1 Tax=Ferrovibrio terrae TaxID=2594003 RepID=UPI0031377FDF
MSTATQTGGLVGWFRQYGNRVAAERERQAQDGPERGRFAQELTMSGGCAEFDCLLARASLDSLLARAINLNGPPGRDR